MGGYIFRGQLLFLIHQDCYDVCMNYVGNYTYMCVQCTVVDPILYFPDPDPTFQEISDLDPDPITDPT